MTRDEVSWPLVAVGAAGAFAIASLLRPRGADAATARPGTPRIELPATIAPGTTAVGSAPLFDFGRPLPGDVRAIVSSGWLAPRGKGAKRRLHRALDIGLSIGTPVLALAEGVVTRAVRTDTGDAGLWVAVRHPSGVTSRYLHLSRVLVDKDQVVKRGEPIGLGGDTGNAKGLPHLHLDLRVPAAMLPLVEQSIGRPSTGWGPDMPPFGHSIPGEPFVPVDAYRDRVKEHATSAGIPLRDPSARRNRSGALVYRPVGARGEPYPDWLRRIKGSSGVYVIRLRDRDGEPVIVYVGESHTDRLYETLTRHFQNWRRWKSFWKDQYTEGHDPGLTYPRARAEVAVRVLPASRALDEEARLIRRLRPRDNLLGQAEPELEDSPF
jgi:hypothetical protein